MSENTPQPQAPTDPRSLRLILDQEEEARLGPAACPSSRALRRRPDPQVEDGHRQQFAVDADRILHSLAYTRYIDKTQVFSLVSNQHITHRVLHVQLVSKIARTIGRMLRLNEDLIEAMALGHDIGHPPFGHDGERFLSEKCEEHGIGPFLHNVQSVRFFQEVEKQGRGLNLTLQVLDGVLCHDGEVHSDRLEPQAGKDFVALDAQIAAKQADPHLELIPMTLEGCVVRMADTLAYVGRDVEDAILLGLIRREDLPEAVAGVLGRTNGTIVYRLVEDLVMGSAREGRLAFSPEKGQALRDLKRFNLERIYTNPRIKKEHPKIREAFRRLFDTYLEDMALERTQSPLFVDFLDQMDPDYTRRREPAEIVRDFIASMTDENLLKNYRNLVWPRQMGSRLD